MCRQGNREAIVGDQAISDDCRGQTETPHSSCRLHSVEEQGKGNLYLSKCYFHILLDSVIISADNSLSCEGAMRNGKSRLPRQPHLPPLQTQPPQSFNPNTRTAQRLNTSHLPRNALIRTAPQSLLFTRNRTRSSQPASLRQLLERNIVTANHRTTSHCDTYLRHHFNCSLRSRHLLVVSASMAATSGLPNGTGTGTSVTSTDEGLPDCIIASSSRWSTLRPFCDRHYHADPHKWGQILPWHFPQYASREVEESFLRQHFTELEVHMHGGVHGSGAGFEFLKQAWYNIAIWNFEVRIPDIADWWLKQKGNISYLEDPAERKRICGAVVTPETFFESREIEDYGRDLMTRVARRIQWLVGRKQDQPAEVAKSPEPQRSGSSSDGTNIITGEQSAEPLPLPSSQPGRVEQPVRSPDDVTPYAQPLPAPTASQVAPFSNDRALEPTSRGVESRDQPSSYRPPQQASGRKRGGRQGSMGNARPSVYDRRQQDYQQNYAPMVQQTPGGLDTSTTYFAPTASAFQQQMQGGPGSQSCGALVPRQHVSYPYMPGNQPCEQGFMTPAAHLNQPQMARNFTRYSDTDRNSDRMSNSGFNNISSQSGDVRRSSVGSRGGSLRGQYNGGRGRGGKSRDSVQEPAPFFDQRPYAQDQSNDFYPKSNAGANYKRRGAYQENTWRSNSERPQMENNVPQRVFSGPDQFSMYPDFQGPQGPNTSKLLPAFNFPANHYGDHYVPLSQRPPPIGGPNQQLEPPDLEIGEKYIGADATHVTHLLVFNIPLRETKDAVAERFTHDCAVPVKNVFLKPLKTQRPGSVQHQMAFIEFHSHNVARQVLDLRGVDLYDRPLSVSVPSRYLGSTPDTYESNKDRFMGQRTDQNARTSSFPAPDMHANWLDEYSHGYQQQPHPSLSGRRIAGYGPTVETAPIGHNTYPPATPFDATKRELPLSTVPSVSTTPGTSEANTPGKASKKNRKNKNKNKNSTPLSKGHEGDKESAQPEAGSKDASQGVPETPVKTKREKQEFQNRSTPAQNATSALNDQVSTEPCALGQVQSEQLSDSHSQMQARKQPLVRDETPVQQQSQGQKQSPRVPMPSPKERQPQNEKQSQQSQTMKLPQAEKQSQVKQQPNAVKQAVKHPQVGKQPATKQSVDKQSQREKQSPTKEQASNEQPSQAGMPSEVDKQPDEKQTQLKKQAQTEKQSSSTKKQAQIEKQPVKKQPQPERQTQDEKRPVEKQRQPERQSHDEKRPVEKQRQPEKQVEGEKQSQNKNQPSTAKQSSSKKPQPETQLLAPKESTFEPVVKAGSERSPTLGPEAVKTPKKSSEVPTGQRSRPVSKSTQLGGPSFSSVNDPFPQQPVTPVSSRDRAGTTDRASDSDHVDDSFHTARASPPMDKQSQEKDITKSSEKSSTPANDKKSGAAGHSISLTTADAVRSGQSTKATLSITVQQQTPQRDEAGIQTQENSSQCSHLKAAPSEDLDARKSFMPAEKLSGSPTTNEKMSLTIQPPPTGLSVPPTPATAYQTAPTTPVFNKPPGSTSSAENSASQSKAPAKKGPSQTESFSMFGKKQQKTKKPAKGKCSIKGKPSDSGITHGIADLSIQNDASGAATPVSSTDLPAPVDRPVLNLTTNSSNGKLVQAAGKSESQSTNKESASGEEGSLAVSDQGSPSKVGTLDRLFGMFGRKKPEDT